MKRQLHTYAWATAIACLCLASCARPVLVVQTSSADLNLEVDAYVQRHEDMTIAYDFWSPDGVPYISFYNVTDQPLLIDLNQSFLRNYAERNNQSIEDVILLQTDNGSYNEMYPDLTFKRIERRVHLVVEPRVWASIYGPSCYSPRGLRNGQGLKFSYAYANDASTETYENISHTFDIAAIRRLKLNEVSTYERTEAGPEQFYIDQQSNVNWNTTSIIIDILVSVLLGF